MVDRNDGSRGEQGAAFLLGEAGYFIVDGPSGAGGHAANAHGPDGVAFNPTNGDLIIYDVKDFLAKQNLTPGPQLVERTANSATAIAQNLNVKWFDALIAKVDASTDMPSRPVISTRLKAARAALAAGTRTWPANTRVSVMKFGGGVIGISQRLIDMGITFIDLNTDQAVQNAKASRRTLFREAADTIDRIARQIENNKSEHALQFKEIQKWDLGTFKGATDTAVSMLGFATQKFFNAELPPLTIWTEAQNHLSAARGFLRANNVVAASLEGALAGSKMKLAVKRMDNWKVKMFGANGSMGAGTKMMIAIPAAAFGLVVVTFGAMAAAPAAIAYFQGLALSLTGAGGAATTVPTQLVRIAAVIETMEVKFRIAETAIEVLEHEVAAFEEVVEPVLRMSR